MYLITENNALAEEGIGKICEVLGRAAPGLDAGAPGRCPRGLRAG
jgi:hypothetical protein